MKHPVDTSQWGEFVIGELFDKCDLKRIKPDFNKHSDLSSTPSEEFNLPLINAKVGNNGIMYYGRSSDWESETMTLDIVNDGAASTGMVYAQPQATGTLYNAYQIKLKPSVHLNLTVSQLLFLATTTQASIQNKFNYENKAIWNKVQAEAIPLPLKPSAGPSNYSQEDIDWDYMETVMSRVTARAKDRLANLPQPSEKQKTPVDTSAWGEFVIGELFDKCDLKRIKPDFNKHSDLSSTPSEEFNLPLINAKVGNNGIMYYGRSSDWESETMTLDIVNDGAASTGMVYAQPQATGTLYNAYQIKLKPSVHLNLTVSQLLFLATTTQASIQNKFNYENKAIWNKVQAESIKLPLKPSADPSNYTQDDIDWTHMEKVMQTIEEKAHARLKSLQKTIA